MCNTPKVQKLRIAKSEKVPKSAKVLKTRQNTEKPIKYLKFEKYILEFTA